MDKSERDEVRIQAVRDQAWESLRRDFRAIMRIAKHGPDGSAQDSALIQRVFLCVGGDLMGQLGLESA